MARPTKQGIDYFPLDVVLDDKFAIIEAEHGLEGFAIVIKLLQKIYSEGYFYKWEEMQLILFSKSISVDRNTVANVVNDCIKWKIFDEGLYSKYKILTSKGIQTRYIQAVYKRVGVEMIEEYLLIDVSDRKNVSCTSVSDIRNEDVSRVSDIESTQSKVNKSKVNKSKVNIILSNDNMSAAADSKELHPVDYTNIMDYWNKHSKLKSITVMTEKRKSHINARVKEHGLEAIYKAIDNVSKSSFLRGQNNRGWIATFDWVFLPNNFVKVLEGNYLDKDTTAKITDDINRRVEALYGGVGRD